ncbi:MULTISPECIES: HAD-IIIC family phosphatase [unclassified Streptomyces]|uniref:HAD-IIIC family phosphatase n=1 Tax=unclassified Streptomyces TaxID=2593676 RepID=UPI002DD8479E|nr:HAD-IIIC family phosphatase [Streptomyces sp. NBC_01750]WSA98249.1 HAD-IIIC family phosphatase [Streptomyces sp. NBC_01794]WSD37214.1 HAD-IIIC family phosphatase [Streptomyces sp. NBC_01750]
MTTTVKCVVWDLDNTVWDGVLLEDGDVKLRPGVAEVIRTLDERGILHSVASRNDHDAALAKLQEFGLAEYFLYPQINWGNKSDSVKAVAEAINIGIDTLAFVDDQPFERDEVAHTHAQVLCIDALDAERIPQLPQMRPRFVTADSRERRHLYRADAQRKQAEETHQGTDEDFLASLDMRFTISAAKERDLQRAEELTVRTNQLNATGYTYSYEELDAFRRSPGHDLLVAGLQDTYGSYGKIGLALVQRGDAVWTVKLLLMSCRVMSRGVGSVLLGHLIRSAHEAGVKLQAEFVPTSRNRTMFVTYKFSGFREIARNGDVSVLEHDGARIPNFPPYMDVTVEV